MTGKQLDLVDHIDLTDYPRSPGWQNRDTSIEAAESVAADLKPLSEDVLNAFREAGDTGLTADEAADTIDRTPFSVRPRVTELNKLGLIVDSGFRRANTSGRKAIVWMIAPKEAMRAAEHESRMRRKSNEAERAAARVMKED